MFSCTEAYRIENGIIGAPVKGATLIGNGPDALTRISMIGNDMRLTRASGHAARTVKASQSGSVSQPFVWIASLLAAQQPEPLTMNISTIIFDFDGVLSPITEPTGLMKCPA